MRILWLVFALLLVATTPAWAANPTTFTWTASVVDATHSAPTYYTVKCGTVTGGPYTMIASTASAVTTLPIASVPGVTAPGTYYCVITASNLAGESGNSAQVAFSLATVPSVPSGLQVQ